MNVYCPLSTAKAQAGISASVTTYDATLLALLDSASREIDGYCHRRFYAETATRYFDTRGNSANVAIDDLLSVTTFTADSDYDHTYDGETWVENTDFTLWPDNEYPKMEVHVTPDGNYAFPFDRKRYLKIVGRFGHGDKRLNPYDSLTPTLTVATTTGTSATVSAATGIEAGHTLKCETEDMYVEAISGTTLTVKRGVNGTTAATHAAAAISVYRYPAPVVALCGYIAAEMLNMAKAAGIASEMIGQYQYTLSSAITSRSSDIMSRNLDLYRREFSYA